MLECLLCRPHDVKRDAFDRTTGKLSCSQKYCVLCVKDAETFYTGKRNLRFPRVCAQDTMLGPSVQNERFQTCSDMFRLFGAEGLRNRANSSEGGRFIAVNRNRGCFRTDSSCRRFGSSFAGVGSKQQHQSFWLHLDECVLQECFDLVSEIKEKTELQNKQS